MGNVTAHAGRNAARWRMGSDPANVKLTPAYILEPVREAMGGIGLDPCTEPDNPTRADAFYALPDNGLAHPWDVDRIWCNPPFGDAATPWARRCIEAGQAGRRVVLLLPADTDTQRMQTLLRAADAVTFIAGRVRFGERANRLPFSMNKGSALLAWGVDLSRAGLGVTLRRLDVEGGIFLAPQ